MIEAVVQQDIENIIGREAGLLGEFAGKSVLVTGSTGMIGRYLVSLLAENNARTNAGGLVIANARNQEKAESMFADYIGGTGFKLLIRDVGDVTDVEGDVDYIIHAASPTQPGDFLERPVDIISANVFATRNLLDLSRKKSAKFCLLSTLEVYGEVASDMYPVLVSESDYGSLNSLSLRSVYPESKRMAENMVVAYMAQHGVDASIIRLAPTISPIVDNSDNRLYAQLIKAAHSGEDVSIFSDAAPKKRSYTYIADAVVGILVGVAGAIKEDFVFNLANEEGVVSIQQLAETVLKCADRDPAKLKVIDRPADPNTSSATGLVLLDSQKLVNLGWRPRYSIEDGVAKTLKQLSGN